MDAFLDQTGQPIGTKVWEPFDAEGEDQLISYLGMCGAVLEPVPTFPENAPSILLTQRSACMPDAVAKLESYVRRGGKAIITSGFLRETWNRGIQDMTSVRLTNRHVLGNRFMIDLSEYDYASIRHAQGCEKILFEVLDYKTNATWADVLLLCDEDNFPILTEDLYGMGKLMILNIPENFADLYKLPAAVSGILCRELSCGLPCYLSAEPKWSLIAYENDIYCLHSFRPMLSRAQLVIRGECKGLQDLETGRIYSNSAILPAPSKRQDGAFTRTAPPEYAFEIPVTPGKSIHLKILR